MELHEGTPSEGTSREQQRLLKRGAEVAGFIPDLVVTFPRPEEQSGSGGCCASGSAFGTAQVAAFFNEVLVNWDKAGEAPSARTMKLYPACSALEEELGAGAEPNLVKVQNAMFSDLAGWLGKERGCSTVAFASCDGDELFLFISLGDCTKRAQDDPVAMEAAEHHGVKFQTALDTTTGQCKLNVLQQIGEREEMYIVYSKKLLSEMDNLLGFQPLTSTGEEKIILRKYHAGLGGVDGTVMRTVDRVRVLMREINTYMDLEDAAEQGVISAYYVPHKLSKLIEFRDGKTEEVNKYDYSHDAWSNFRFWTIMKGFHWDENRSQPIHEIHDYFGDRLGFYFLWLGFSVKGLYCMLPVTAVFAVLYSIYDPKLISAKEDPESKAQKEAEEAYVYVAASFFFCTATWLYTTCWSRLQHHYASLWELDQHKVLPDALRPDYRGDLVPNPLNENKRTKQYPGWKALLAETTVVVVTGVFIVLVVLAVLAIYWLQSVIQSKLSVHYGEDAGTCAHPKYWDPTFCTSDANSKDPEEKNCCDAQTGANTIASGLFSVQIVVFQKVWNSIHLKLVDLANPRTEEHARNLQVGLLFPFSFFATYMNVFFHAFYNMWAEPCTTADCLYILRPSMYKVVLPAILVEIVSMLIPFAMYRWSLHSEEKDLKAKTGQDAVERTFIEAQAKRPAYGVSELNQDINIIMILLGYVLLFGFAAPFVSAVVAVTLAVKLRIDAFKFCSAYRRIIPADDVMGLGAWNHVLTTLAAIGRYTVFAVPVFNLEYFNEPPEQSSVVWLMRLVGDSMSTEQVMTSTNASGLTGYEKLVLVALLKEMVDLVLYVSSLCFADVAKSTVLLIAKRSMMRAKLMSELVAATNEDNGAKDDPVHEIKRSLQQRARQMSESLAAGAVNKLDSASAEWQNYESGNFGQGNLMRTFFGRERA